jgi:delta14-sterol reductase
MPLSLGPLTLAPVTIEAFLDALLAESAFVLLLAVGSLLLPGRVHHGAPGPDGLAPAYKLNGFLLFALTLAGALAGHLTRVIPLSVIAEQLPALLLAANVLAFSGAAVLIVRSRQRGTHVLADFFYGREANPRWVGLDLKMFSYRPSLIGLGLINFSLAALQVGRHGHLTLRMALYQVLFFVYLGNYFQFESGMLYTWDVVAEKFGWMLVWGDYVLVPFFYSLPGWYLVDDLEPIPFAAIVALVTLYAAGFLIFRGANQQKHRFKQDRNIRIWGAPAKTLDGRLLVSGFWGIGRKLNYTGELSMYWSWTLLCGFHSLVPLWLTCLLPHRAWRDEKRCRAKYGKLWDDYCARAKFRMIPFVY